MNVFPVGKLDPRYLREMMESLPSDDPALVVGPAIGNDAAAIEIDGNCLVFTTDPITFTADSAGWYAVNVNANDVAAMGARPRWFLADILLPEGTCDKDMVETIFSEIGETCRELGIAVCGGHTEVTSGLSRPIVVGHMIGVVARDGLKRLSEIRPGDRVFMTKGIAIEGTSIAATEKRVELTATLGEALVARARSFNRQPGISVVREAGVAAAISGVHAMHDPTEGGIATGLWEVAEGSGLSIEVYRERIKIYDETSIVCRELGLDPLGLIASGSLIIVVEEDSAGKLAEALDGEGVPCSSIGHVLQEEGKGVSIVEGGTRRTLEPFFQDEIAKIL